MHELIWVPLKIRNIPLIEREVSCLMEMYFNIKKRIQKGDIEAVHDWAELK